MVEVTKTIEVGVILSHSYESEITPDDLKEFMKYAVQGFTEIVLIGDFDVASCRPEDKEELNMVIDGDRTVYKTLQGEKVCRVHHCLDQATPEEIAEDYPNPIINLSCQSFIDKGGEEDEDEE